ncbi:Bowman-Birk type wound-induced proteinase inhibitor WIP1-like [Triticum dicoccoides]|uniref:Bowman-Birk type wound-induced proteinase inhibitor WIP1-like n=1 Tax=Triticum dicoccoides TaxID=85692 RepID=UPI001890B166|nr:Bowman-Birk type wound-induced proteinase inhibitor WIP1-like [Triticum dicoccoides]XP_044336504.1 Bowman-Birk type wound-induced proteinase inhibitor WIP1-like [Triticum aestivum]
MKSSTLMAIMVLQAALVMGIFPGMCNSDVHATSLGESQVIDINPGRLGSCANCNFSFSGLYTCKSCAVVKKYPVMEFRCTDTFLGVCEPPRKKN